MKVSVTRAGLGLGILVVLSCGGGGGGVSQSSQIIRQDSFSVSAGASANKTFGAIDIQIPAGAFPTGATLTLKQYAAAPFRPANPNFVPTHSLELTSSAAPSSNIALSVPDAGQIYLVALKDGQRFVGLKDARSNGRLRFVLPKSDLTATPGAQAPKTIWQTVVGIVKDNLPDPELALIHFSGSDDFGAPGTAVYIHGSLDNAWSMKSLSNQLSPRLGFNHCYSLAYDWRLSAATVADYLGGLLDQAKSKGKNITLIGHSRGGVIARYALERRGRTHAVRELVSLNSPHQGTWAATATDVIAALAIEWLNSNALCSPFTVTLNDPGVTELRKGSSFLTDLNTYHGAQRGNVDYTIVAGSQDWFVPESSGLAAAVTLPELTGGVVHRTTISGATHSSVKTNSDQIAAIATAIKANDGANVVLAPDRLAVDAVSDGWDYQLTVRNTSAETVVVEDLAFDGYSRSGLWSGVQYFDPTTASGEFFPSDYRAWNEQLQPNEAASFSIHVWTDSQRHAIWEAPAERQAGIAGLTARGRTSTGRRFEANVAIKLHYGSIWPSAAKMRRPGDVATASPAMITSGNKLPR